MVIVTDREHSLLLTLNRHHQRDAVGAHLVLVKRRLHLAHLSRDLHQLVDSTRIFRLRRRPHRQRGRQQSNNCLLHNSSEFFC